MRTPNCNCIMCNKEMYRRPFELRKVRYVACIDCREKAKKICPLTKPQEQALEIGRHRKGNNGLIGRKQTTESKIKRSNSLKEWCSNNPEKVKQRGEKNSGVNHYMWKDGASGLQNGIRTLSQNQTWIHNIKERDNFKCVRCNSTENLEVHHVIPLQELIISSKIKVYWEAKDNRDLFNIDNGITLCRKCHYTIHGRISHEY